MYFENSSMPKFVPAFNTTGATDLFMMDICRTPTKSLDSTPLLIKKHSFTTDPSQ